MINMELEYRRYLSKYFNLRNIYKSAKSFSDGLAIVESSQGYGAINKEFNEVIPCEYDKLSSFSEGLAYFEKKEGDKTVKGFINKNNEIVFKLDNYYQFVSGFNNGVAVLKSNSGYSGEDLYYYVNKDGKIFPKEGFSKANPFSEGYGAAAEKALYARKNHEWSLYNNDFEVVAKGFEFIEDFRGGIAHAKFYETEGFIDITGKFVIEYNRDLRGGKTYYDAEGEYIYVSKHSERDYYPKYYKINKKDGKTIEIEAKEFKEGIKKKERFTCERNIIGNSDARRIIDNSSNRTIFESKNIGIGGYSEGLCPYHGEYTLDRHYIYGKTRLTIEEVGYIDETGQRKPLNNIIIPEELKYEKKLFKYQLQNGLSLKYKPLYDLGSYILCVDKTGYYLFNKSDEHYIRFSDTMAENIFFSGNVLCIDNKTYIIVGEKVIDIGNISVTNVDIKQGVSCSDVLSFEEFKIEVQKNPHIIEDFLEKKQKDELKENAISSLKRAEDEDNKLYLVNQAIQRTMAQLNMLLNIKQSLINSTNSTTFERYNIDRDMLLLEKDDHWIINPDLYGMLRFFDLSAIDFTNVAVNNIDLSYSNAKIDPQKVYNKDMSGGNFSGMQFIGADFHDVNICGAKFTDCLLDFTDIKDGSIYDDYTIFPEERKV